SSRRRHTRLQGDWSSDVCSSDLPARALSVFSVAFQELFAVVIQDVVLAGNIKNILRFGAFQDLVNGIELFGLRQMTDVSRVQKRSEERRVGKECRARRRR